MADSLNRPEMPAQSQPVVAEPTALYAALHDDSATPTPILERGELLRCIAHDLRTPLNVIALSVAVLSGPAVSKPRAQALRRIVDSTAMIKNLISDLLSESPPLPSRSKLDLRITMSDALVKDALRMMQPIADAARVRLVAGLQAKAEPVLIDRQRMLRVFANLIGNAIRFSAVDSSITVAVESSADDVRFSINDTGPGIAAEDLDHVFDRFWRANPQASTEGSGLGLSIVKRIVQAHGGVVGVHSIPGVGTSFHFTLPRAAAAGRQEPPVAAAHQ